MHPVKAKLNKEYFLEKVDHLVNTEQSKLKLQIRKTRSILESIDRFLTLRQILTSDFWGYGIEILDNGIKVVEQSTSPTAGYLMCLFRSDGDGFRFYYVRIAYRTGTVSEEIRSVALRRDYITDVSCSDDGIISLYSQELDRPMQIKTDNLNNANYYVEKFSQGIGSADIDTISATDSFDSDIHAILKALSQAPDRRAELPALLDELQLQYDDRDVAEFANYLDKQGYADVAHYAEGAELRLTRSGISYLSDFDPLDSLSKAELNPSISNESTNVASENKKSNVEDKPWPKWIWITGAVTASVAVIRFILELIDII